MHNKKHVSILCEFLSVKYTGYVPCLRVQKFQTLRMLGILPSAWVLRKGNAELPPSD